jgi:hypothetical protein
MMNSEYTVINFSSWKQKLQLVILGSFFSVNIYLFTIAVIIPWRKTGFFPLKQLFVNGFFVWLFMAVMIYIKFKKKRWRWAATKSQFNRIVIADDKKSIALTEDLFLAKKRMIIPVASIQEISMINYHPEISIAENRFGLDFVLKNGRNITVYVDCQNEIDFRKCIRQLAAISGVKIVDNIYSAKDNPLISESACIAPVSEWQNVNTFLPQSDFLCRLPKGLQKKQKDQGGCTYVYSRMFEWPFYLLILCVSSLFFLFSWQLDWIDWENPGIWEVFLLLIPLITLGVFLKNSLPIQLFSLESHWFIYKLQWLGICWRQKKIALTDIDRVASQLSDPFSAKLVILYKNSIFIVKNLNLETAMYLSGEIKKIVSQTCK